MRTHTRAGNMANVVRTACTSALFARAIFGGNMWYVLIKVEKTWICIQDQRKEHDVLFGDHKDHTCQETVPEM